MCEVEVGMPNTREVSNVPHSAGASSLAGLKYPYALYAIALSTGVATLTWLAACLGRAYIAGRYSALALDGLALPAIDQTHTYVGIEILLRSAVSAVVFIFIVRIIYMPLYWAVHKVSLKFNFTIPFYVRKRIWCIALILVLTDGAICFKQMSTLKKYGDGIVLKKASEVGNTWTHVIFDTDSTTVSNLEFGYGALLAVFVGLSWWLITKGLRHPWGKVAFALYALAGALSFMFGFSYLLGIADTVQDFPVVAFSGMSTSDHGYILFLLGEDDKAFAFLSVHVDGSMNVDSKYVLYVPRTEVKWISVIKSMPIYRTADINDLVRLSEQMNNKPQ